MRCQEAFEAMSATLDGELRLADTQPLRQHLAGCDHCRASQGQLHEVDRQVRGLREPSRDRHPLPAALRGRIEQRLARRSRRISPVGFAVALGGATAFGALAVIAFAHSRPEGLPDGAFAVVGPAVDLFVIGADGLRSRRPSGARLAPGDRVEVDGTSQAAARLQLGDGTRLVLAPGAVLSLGAARGGLTVEQGRVLFEVPTRVPELRVETHAGAVALGPGQTELVAERAEKEPEPQLAGVVTVVVHTGSARLLGGGQTLALGIGQSGWLAPGQAPHDASNGQGVSWPGRPRGRDEGDNLLVPAAVASRPRPTAVAQPRRPVVAMAASATGPATPPGEEAIRSGADRRPATQGHGGACQIARGESFVARACAEGGIMGAKKTMKKMVATAKDGGKKFECDSCHRNEDDWTLTDDAREKFTALVAANPT